MPNPIVKSSSGTEPQTAEGHSTREEVELRAYQIYIERGGAHGQDVDDWLQAELELLQKYTRIGRAAKAAG